MSKIFKIKVMHILSSLNSSWGIIHLIRNFFDELGQEDIEFDFLYFLDTPNDMSAYFKEKHAKLYKFDKLNLKNYKKVKKQMVQALIDADCDIVHLHMPILHFVVKSAIKEANKVLNKKIKIILHAHDIVLSSYFLKSIRSRLMLTGCCKNTDMLLACSKRAGKVFFGKHFKKDGKVLYNAINLDRFNKKSNRLSELKNEFNIKDQTVYCHVGRICKQKNQTFLIDIFNEIVKKSPDSKLLIVGNGDADKINEVNEKIKRYNLTDKVVLTGSRQDVQDILQIVDFFVFPSIHEGLGIVLIESQVAKVVSVASTMCPEESKISNLITYLPLKLSAKEWAESILKIKYPEKVEIDTSEYDISNSAKNLLNIYSSIL